MKEFNKKEMLDGKKMVYRNGSQVVYYAYYDNARDGIRLITWDITGDIHTHFENGKLNNNTIAQFDLFMSSEFKEVYIAIQKEPEHDNKLLTTCAYYSKEDLLRNFEFAKDEKKYVIISQQIEL
jgi:hypothetical protein